MVNRKSNNWSKIHRKDKADDVKHAQNQDAAAFSVGYRQDIKIKSDVDRVMAAGLEAFAQLAQAITAPSGVVMVGCKVDEDSPKGQAIRTMHDLVKQLKLIETVPPISWSRAFGYTCGGLENLQRLAAYYEQTARLHYPSVANDCRKRQRTSVNRRR